MVVRGAFSFDPEGLPESYDEAAQEDYATPGRVVGQVLSQTGFMTEFDKDVVVVVECSGPWCGQPVPSDDALLFLHESGGAYFLYVSPCVPHMFATPSEADFDAMVACYNGNCPDS